MRRSSDTARRTLYPLPCGTWSEYCANPDCPAGDSAVALQDALIRPGTMRLQGFSGQNSFIDCGKIPSYRETGGIHGE